MNDAFLPFGNYRTPDRAKALEDALGVHADEFPFGKYKGEPFLEVIYYSDPAYWCWVLLQPSLWKKHGHTLLFLWETQGPEIFSRAVWEAQQSGRRRG